MRDLMAMSIRQPSAYLAGSLKGDAWISSGSKNSKHGYLCLRVADEDFANAFADAIRAGYGVPCVPKLDERGYWLVSKYNGYARFSHLRNLTPVSHEERAAWLRGMFDSEGNASLISRPEKGSGSYSRRVSFYSTDTETISCVSEHLAFFGMETRVRTCKPSKGHKGSKPVFEIALRSSREAYAGFAAKVGSSIARKQQVLDAIPQSYSPDLSAAYRRGQLLGAATKRRKREQRLPIVLDGIRALIDKGIRPTDSIMLREIPGYSTQKKYYKVRELVEMACTE